MTQRQLSAAARRRAALGVVAAVAALAVLAVVVLLLGPAARSGGAAPTSSPAPVSVAPAPASVAPSAVPSTAPSAVPSTAPPSGGVDAGVTVAAVGDLVCDPNLADEDGDGRGPRQCQMQAVSDLLVARRPAALLALGDTQYSSGTPAAYRSRYAPTYGRLLAVTRPVPGNHEYLTPGAAGYFAYFGARAGSPSQGYYSYDLGGWHLVALNSNCSEVSCAPGSAQERWLHADLAAHPARCTLAYWHHPRWSHGRHGDDAAVAPLVADLTAAKADVLLTGHDHDYERYTPRAADGTADPQGIREFVVGTGGRDVRSDDGGDGTEAFDSDTFGALFLTLTPAGYRWRFEGVAGASFSDAGSATCV